MISEKLEKFDIIPPKHKLDYQLLNNPNKWASDSNYMAHTVHSAVKRMLKMVISRKERKANA